MSRDSIRGFAAGLLFATTVIGSFYYFLEEDQQQDLTIEELKQASNEKGFELIEKDKMIKENLQPETTDVPDKETTTSSTAPQAETFQFQITNGMGSDDIARLLFENNIIENADQFEIYLKANDLTKKIQIGTYQIDKGMSVEEISNTITQ